VFGHALQLLVAQAEQYEVVAFLLLAAGAVVISLAEPPWTALPEIS
jgi:hypothetical protein